MMRATQSFVTPPNSISGRQQRRWRLHASGFVLLALAPLLGGCGHDDPSANPQHDVRTEARREQDCASPSWKAANLGLWYNLCQSNTY